MILDSSLDEVKVGIVVVSYKNPMMTAHFVREELSKLTHPYSLMVVNNASTPQECVSLANDCKVDPSCVLCSHENLGYARGNNLGVKELQKRGNFTHFLFSNDDVEIQNPNILQHLIDTMACHTDVAAIGPRVVGLDGHDQSPHDIYISPYRQIGWKLFAMFRKKKRVNPAEETPQPRYTYWVQGSFMLVDTVAFNLVGGFDANTFLYFEEPILSERFKKIGKKVYYDPTTSVLHYEGLSTQNNKSRIAIENESRLYYYRKYKNVPKIVLFFLNLLMNR